MRSLSPEEAELWGRVASTIRPLSRDKDQRTSLPPASATRAAARPAGAPPRSRATAPAALGTTLDGSWDRRLARGTAEPDRIVDLHGLSLDGAWRAIDHALEQAISRGERLLLLITGHARSGEPPLRRGAIRAAVHNWLFASPHAGKIAAVRGAHRRHGGGGSLYIVLRRDSRSR